MGLTIRFLRALWIFGLILSSYLIQLGLQRVLRRFERDPETKREKMRLPAWLWARRKRVDARNAKRLLRGMLRLRGVYIKMGQVLSIMGGFLPRVYGKELESLQDHVPAHDFEEIEAAIIHELGKPPAELFKDFEKVPIAAASLGQVHVAHLHDGTKVAVKVLYPRIRDVIRVDMRILRLAVRVYKMFFPFNGLDRVHDSLVDLLRRETDYLHEAECMDRMAKNFEGDDELLFPKVIRDRTTKDVLTMTFMEGMKITNFAEYTKQGVDREQVATKLVQSFYKQLFVDRFFHADPHPGNFLVQAPVAPGEPAKIVILDFGAISEASDSMIDGMIDILQGVFTEDSSSVLKGFRRMGFVAEEGNKELLEKTVITYFEKLLKVKDRTPGAIMRAQQNELAALANPEVERQELRELMRSFEYPEGWFYVERAAVMMFWLTGQMAPDLDSMQVGFPYVMPLLMQRQAELTKDL